MKSYKVKSISLVSTNFNVANTSNGFGYPCWRYDKAQELLGQLLDKKGELTAEDVTSVMDAVHEDGIKGGSWTLETMVADLVNGVMYIYYFYQYDRPFVLNVKEELSNPREAGPLSKLFPDDVKEEAARRFEKTQLPKKINKVTGMSWTALILVSLALFFTFYAGNKKGFRFWIPAVVILGPVALLVMLIVGKRINTSRWRKALIETTGNLIPIVIIYTVSLLVLAILTLNHGVTQLFQLLMMLGLPFFGGWLIFQGPVLGLMSQKNFGRFLIQRLPQVLIITLIGLAGVFPVSMPLINKSLNISQLMPLSPWIVMTFLAIIVLSSMAGGILIYLYEYWAVKRGFQAWMILAGNEGEVSTPSWNKIWWWILISIVILFNGLIAGAVLLK
jgi:hypothetical protein